MSSSRRPENSSENQGIPRQDGTPTLSSDLHELTALEALGVLASEDRARLEELLQEGSDAARAALASFRETVGAMTRAIGEGEESPPPELASRLRARIAKVEQSESGAERTSQNSRSVTAPSPPPVQVWKHWLKRDDAARENGLHVVRHDDGDWEETGAPGVRAKSLYTDPDRRYVTMLVRMAPGASYPSHRHAGVEECFVLEGDLRVGSTLLRAGDYQRADSQSSHEVQSTEHGCLLLLVSSQDDELL